MESKKSFPFTERAEEDDGASQDVYDKMFNEQQGFNVNLSGGAPAQVDAGSSAYLAKIGEKSKDEVKPKVEDDSKISVAVPKIGALGAFAALGGGLIGSVATSKAVPRKSVEDIDPEKGTQVPKEGLLKARDENTVAHRLEDYNDKALSSSLMRNYTTGNVCCEDESHSTQLYPHAHHVMPRIRHRAKKKTSFPSVSSNEEVRERKHKKTKKFTKPLPTIADERNPISEFDFTTTADDDSERESKRGKKASILKFSDNESHERVLSESSVKSESDSDAERQIEPKPKMSTGSKKMVMFSVGQSDKESDQEKGTAVREKDGDESDGRARKKKHRKKLRTDQELKLRRRIGSQVRMDEDVDVVAEDEDLEHRAQVEMASHRMEKSHSRHRISAGVVRVQRNRRDSVDYVLAEEKKFMEKMYGPMKTFDHSPHAIFVEMDELDLDGSEWVEQARWVKYEERREEGSERWGRPHLSSLSFHSLINLRVNIEKGIVMLDMEAKDFTNVSFKVAEEFTSLGLLPEESKSDLLRILLFRHSFVEEVKGGKFQKISGIRRTLSKSSIGNLLPSDEKGNAESKMSKAQTMIGMASGKSSTQSNGGKDHTILELANYNDGGDVDVPTVQSFAALYNLGVQRSTGGISNRLKEGTEGTVVLVGKWPQLNRPLCGFVRLATGTQMPNLMEVNIPVRFIFLLLVPPFMTNVDPHEVGRSFSTLMASPAFHVACYDIQERREFLSALNQFLDESVVLPPGDWDSKSLISLSEIRNLKARKKARKDAAEQKKKEMEAAVGGTELKDKTEDEGEDDGEYNPMQMTFLKKSKFPYPWGGVIGDIKYRFPWYWSDIRDGLNGQSLAASIFIYFAALSGAVAFGGLTGEKSDGLIGISETIITSAVAGSVFALLAGQPLIITGVTGPILLYDEALYGFSKTANVEFLPWRIWIGIWVVIIALLMSCFQGSVLVRFFTKFTKDIFASLVSLLFIYEAIKKLIVIFAAHPLSSVEFYCNATYESFLINKTSDGGNVTQTPLDKTERVEPNTALLSLILMFGTFFIGYFLRIFRNGKYLGRTARRALGDFGVPIAIIIMVVIDYSAGDTHTEKLNVPDGLQVTSPRLRGWLINPFGISRDIPSWLPFIAVLPAMLLYMVLFIETEICELLMIDRSKRKGGGLHWDIVLLCFINCACAIFGGPWICAATVRASAHVSALTVWSTTHAPGEASTIVEVKDQRMSALLVSVLLGLSVLLSVALKQVPFAVLFGVFLYMGVSSINGIQFFDRLALFFVPVKHHPRLSYVLRVKTWKMHLYTFIQACGLGVLWALKSSPAVLVFPFFVVGMIPLRYSLKFFFTERELKELDGKEAGQVVAEGDADFYEEGIGG